MALQQISYDIVSDEIDRKAYVMELARQTPYLRREGDILRIRNIPSKEVTDLRVNLNRKLLTIVGTFGLTLTQDKYPQTYFIDIRRKK